MSDVLGALRGFFVAPAAGVRTRAVPPSPPGVALLGRPRDVALAAPAVALALARRRGARCALVAGWRLGEGTAPSWPPAAAARRLALRLDARGIGARATGRLVHATLPDDPVDAAAAAERAAGASPGPVALALGGPRDAVLDGLLARQDALVVVRGRGDDPALTALAAERLAALRVPVVTCELPAATALRPLVTAGATLPRPLRAAVAPALEAIAS